MTTSEVLVAAREILSDPAHWCKGSYAEDGQGLPVSPTNSRALRFCAWGAVLHVLGLDLARDLIPRADEPLGMLRQAQIYFINNEGWPAAMSAVDANDMLGHTAVLRLFDKAIELAKSA